MSCIIIKNTIALRIKNIIIGIRHFFGKSESMIKNLRIKSLPKKIKTGNGSTFNKRRRVNDATKHAPDRCK